MSSVNVEFMQMSASATLCLPCFPHNGKELSHKQIYGNALNGVLKHPSEADVASCGKLSSEH